MLELRVIRPLPGEDQSSDEAYLQVWLQQLQIDHATMIPRFTDRVSWLLKGSIPTWTGLRRHLWFITLDQQPIGFVTLQDGWPPFKYCMTIADFFLSPEYRGQGLGKQAFAMIVQSIFIRFEHVQRIGLSVYVDNHVARQLYFTAGFTPMLEVLQLERPTTTELMGKGVLQS